MTVSHHSGILYNFLRSSDAKKRLCVYNIYEYGHHLCIRTLV